MGSLMMHFLRKCCCDDDDDDDEEHIDEEDYQQRRRLRRLEQQHHYQLQYGAPPASSSLSSSFWNNRMNRSLVNNNWSPLDATHSTMEATTAPTATTASLGDDSGNFYNPASAWFGRVLADRRAATTGSTHASTSHLPSYQIAPQRSDSHEEEADDDDDDDDLSDHRNCCQPGERRPAEPHDRGPNNNHLFVEPSSSLDATRGESDGRGDASSHVTIQEFFRNLAERWRVYDDALEQDHTHANRHASMAVEDDGQKQQQHYQHSHHHHPPLRQASRFDSSSDILTIRPDEIVLPGSDLQQQMAVAALSKYNLTRKEKTTSKDDDDVDVDLDECVICMEGFDPTNPRMPTLCGCGENKTYFHLPCLYQWMEQSRECPSCRQQLRWEEF